MVIRQEAGSEQSWSTVSLGKLFLGGEKEEPAMLGWYEEEEVASDAMCLCDVTGSRDIWAHHGECHLFLL